MHRIEEKLPHFADRTKKRFSEYSEVTLTTAKGITTFFTKKGKERRQQKSSGFFSDVTPAYDSVESLKKDIPLFSIKKMRINGGAPQLESAIKEVECNRAIGRFSCLFQGKNKLCVLYDWQAGVSLYSMRNDLNKISDQILIMWIESLLAGIVQLHEVNIAHNDVTPANIIVTNNNTVSLVDFGIATMGNAASGFFRNDLQKVLFLLEGFITRRQHLVSMSDLLPTFHQILSDNVSHWSSKQAHECLKKMNTRSSM
jgi:serine/threonine protein kinase